VDVSNVPEAANTPPFNELAAWAWFLGPGLRPGLGGSGSLLLALGATFVVPNLDIIFMRLEATSASPHKQIHGHQPFVNVIHGPFIAIIVQVNLHQGLWFLA
jgi:hypothetical protein